MIYLITGENSFEIEQELDRMKRESNGSTESYDGLSLTIDQLPDLLMGVTLFQESRLVIIKELSSNKSVWEELLYWLGRLSDQITLVLVESKPDKRTKLFKELMTQAEVKEYSQWTPRDTHKAKAWIQIEASKLGISLTNQQTETLISRVGLHQWSLYQSLRKLAVLNEITNQIIIDVTDQNSDEDVFILLETALRGDVSQLHKKINVLSRTNDPYQTFGLLASQIVQLRLLSLTNESPSQIAKDSSVHPYGLSKLAPYAKRLGKSTIKVFSQEAAQVDMKLKSTSHDPWRLVEYMLLKIAHS